MLRISFHNNKIYSR